MIFDSLPFAIFLLIVFILHWFCFNKSKKNQNSLLLLASFVFYSFWDWRFLFLLVFSILLNYWGGIKIDSSVKYKKVYIIFFVVINVFLLGFFKYYNFFAESLNQLLFSVGIKENLVLLKIILPVGISFYTFHGLSYIIDIYYGRIKPTKDIVDYSLFVSYFPLLVAGPIERASHLLPQLETKREFSYLQATEGLKQISWGGFKKIVVADTCAGHVNAIFGDYYTQTGSTLFLGAFLFTIQIYCDFSGYSDFALGVSRLFGINLLKNFNYPYFSRNMAEFWRRWHISLSSWFKDYLYIPLGGSRKGLALQIRNTFIIFLVSGFWHGANWTFIIWGGLNACFIIPSILFHTNRRTLGTIAEGKIFPSFREGWQLFVTFLLTIFAWIVFRSESIKDAYLYLEGIFNSSFFTIPLHISWSLFSLIFIMFFIEWFGRFKNFALERIGANWNRGVRWSFYLLLILIIFANITENQHDFIYFQF